MMFTFVWGSQMERLKHSTLYKAVENGGKMVPGLLNIIRAQGISKLVPYIHKTDRKASYFEQYFATPILRTLVLSTIDHTVPYCWERFCLQLRSAHGWAGILEVQGHHGLHSLQGHHCPPESQLSRGPATGC
ncbi:hypothetical protein J4Q44_G00145650 [Coregonus suidteri]|uniref:Uncharacterized protein n=1 Tax=Coregonus suidteri TaxID=861788 RepID=A0AAN8QX59_9TELE